MRKGNRISLIKHIIIETIENGIAKIENNRNMKLEKEKERKKKWKE